MEDLGIDEKHPKPLKTKKLGEVQGSYTYFADGDVLLAKVTPCFQNGKLGIAKGLSNGVGFGSSEFFVFRPLPGLDSEYLYYFLSRADFREEGVKQMGGAVGLQRVPPEFVLSERLPLPPLPEQRRIVGILDEAFAGIATAKANAEKNLRNAREVVAPVFGEVLSSVSSKGLPNFQVEQLAAPAKGSIRTGPFGSQLLHGEFVDNGIAVLGIDNAVQNRFAWDQRRYITKEKYSELKRYTVRPGDVIITIMGTCGRCAVIPADIPTAINSKHLCCITLDQSKCLPEYLHAYFLNHPQAKDFLAARATGSIMEGLNMGIIKELPVLLPSLADQKRVMLKFSAVYVGIKHLESLYQQKLAALDALKKSLLHQAFSGQLGERTVDRKPVAVEKPLLRITGMSPNELHALVLIKSYRLHEAHGNLSEFGRVKAEKTAHLIEYHFGIDLERRPVKDAAGPNDFAHFHRMRHRAEKAGWFKFDEKAGSTFIFEPLKKIDKLPSRAALLLGDLEFKIDAFLKLLLPLTWREAELIATVYAGWNNLLIDGKSPTDEEIVYESRENWHPEKLKIARHLFFEAVEWLRKQGVIPAGRGRRVEKQLVI
jgi:type I restriction enzyme S subunit